MRCPPGDGAPEPPATARRVTRGELRVFPLVPIGAVSRYPRLDALFADLRTHAIAGRIVDVDYEFQVGGNEMLICRPITGRSAP